MVSHSYLKTVIDASSKYCMGETYKFCNAQVYKIPMQLHSKRSIRLLAKTSIRFERYLLRKKKDSQLHKSNILNRDIQKVKKIVRECNDVIYQKDLHKSDIGNLTSKLGVRLNNRYQKNGYFDIIVMMLKHKLPYQRYYTKTHRHHKHHNHHSH